jgi:peptidoglycan/xylan/chitin deacetylase (PgdA/CDA1 family)
MPPPSDNRAVSALFRVFGGAGVPVVADVQVISHCRGMHRGEVLFLGGLIPLTVLVALGEILVRYLGVVPGFLLALPLTFLVLNLLPIAAAVGGQAWQWRLSLLALVIWSVNRWNAGGVAGVFAWLWIAVLCLNLTACILLVLKSSMRLGNGWRIILLAALHAAAVAIGWKYGWQWALSGGAAIAAAFCWAVLRPGCQWLGEVICQTDSREIWITIDDGPDPHDTPVLLDLLDRHHTKAVFFMIGEKVRKHPELAREVIRRGHQIGNHTMSHPQASFWCAGPWRTRREIADCQRVIEDITGTRPRWFRAPVGHRNFFTHPIARALGLEIMAWNRRGFDAVETNADKVLARILPDLSHGDIVLLHESTPIAAEVLGKVLEKVTLRPPPAD